MKCYTLIPLHKTRVLAKLLQRKNKNEPMKDFPDPCQVEGCDGLYEWTGAVMTCSECNEVHPDYTDPENLDQEIGRLTEKD